MNTNAAEPQDSDSSITIRPIRLTDQAMEADFIRRLSPESKHFRFFGGVRELNPAMLKEFCDVDGRHSMAFVATVREGDHEIEVGVARFAPGMDEDHREMAVTVADKWQNKGIGTFLARKLIEFARDHGVKNIYSVDLADNIHMRQLANELDMRSRRDPEDSRQVIYELEL